MPNTDTIPRTLVADLAGDARDLYLLSIYSTRDADRALDREDDHDKFHRLSALSLAQEMRAQSLLDWMAYEFHLSPPVPYAPVAR